MELSALVDVVMVLANALMVGLVCVGQWLARRAARQEAQIAATIREAERLIATVTRERDITAAIRVSRPAAGTLDELVMWN